MKKTLLILRLCKDSRFVISDITINVGFFNSCNYVHHLRLIFSYEMNIYDKITL